METKERKVVQTSVSVIHEVKDFEKWHTIYLEKSNADARIGVLRNIDNPNYLFIGEKTDSHDSAKEFFSSEDLKAAMQAGGVISKPEIRYLNLFYFDALRNESVYRVSISHEVANFEAWKVIFDSDEDRRKENGLTLTGLATVEDNPAEVFVVFASDDIESAKAYINNPVLKDLMAQAGVVSAPEINFWKRF